MVFRKKSSVSSRSNALVLPGEKPWILWEKSSGFSRRRMPILIREELLLLHEKKSSGSSRSRRVQALEAEDEFRLF